ncbi:Hypothetical protein CINCED_3A003009 [Cinara cedri]|uniref:Uncharacterized protein n=1 Tax=Cinara cedri TaxID=506608 RepID=A0A5E4MZ89_9HEMI|nr:Hypothetical protein CINCED_3A003009 [Cinara cedri]
MTSELSSDESVNELKTIRLANQVSTPETYIEKFAAMEKISEITFSGIMEANYRQMETSYKETKERLNMISSENETFKRVARSLLCDVQACTDDDNDQLLSDVKDCFEALEKCGQGLADKLLAYKVRETEVNEQLEKAEERLAQNLEEEIRLKTQFKTLQASRTATQRDCGAYEKSLRDDSKRLTTEMDEALVNLLNEQKALEELNKVAQEIAFGFGTYVKDTIARTKELHGNNIELRTKLEASRAIERELRAKLRAKGCSKSQCVDDSSQTTCSWSTDDDCRDGPSRKPNQQCDFFVKLSNERDDEQETDII